MNLGFVNFNKCKEYKIVISGFRVSYFQQLYCITIVLHLYIWKSCACISYCPSIISPRIYETISVIKNLQYDFPKMRGGSNAVWNFSKISSDLVAGPFPQLIDHIPFDGLFPLGHPLSFAEFVSPKNFAEWGGTPPPPFTESLPN